MNVGPAGARGRIGGRFDLTAIVGLLAAAGMFVLAQVIEGGSLRSLWQPTAAIVVFGGTLSAVFVSFSRDALRRTAAAIRGVFLAPTQPTLEPTLRHIVELAQTSRRKGLLALDAEIDRSASSFLRTALTLVVDDTSPSTARQILEIEHQTLMAEEELPAEVLETAAGYSPTLGILGAVLGLIHVMESLTEPSKLGSGIAVAFVATVYGVAAANLVLLPLATRLRGRARDDSLSREVIIEGVMALQEGLNPRLVEQKLRGYLGSHHHPAARAVTRFVA